MVWDILWGSIRRPFFYGDFIYFHIYQFFLKIGSDAFKTRRIFCRFFFCTLIKILRPFRPMLSSRAVLDIADRLGITNNAGVADHCGVVNKVVVADCSGITNLFGFTNFFGFTSAFGFVNFSGFVDFLVQRTVLVSQTFCSRKGFWSRELFWFPQRSLFQNFWWRESCSGFMYFLVSRPV